MSYPKNVWAGYNGSSTTATAVAQTSTNFPNWHDAGVYAGGMPEYRLYHWTETDPATKTFYTMEFMMTATPSTGTNARANATNCPDGTCSTTKVFIYLRQITTP